MFIKSCRPYSFFFSLIFSQSVSGFSVCSNNFCWMYCLNFVAYFIDSETVITVVQQKTNYAASYNNYCLEWRRTVAKASKQFFFIARNRSERETNWLTHRLTTVSIIKNAGDFILFIINILCNWYLLTWFPILVFSFILVLSLCCSLTITYVTDTWMWPFATILPCFYLTIYKLIFHANW